MLRHDANSLRSKVSRLTRGANEHGRPHSLNNALEAVLRWIGQPYRGQVGRVQRNFALVGFQVLACLTNHTSGIDKDLALPSLIIRQPLRLQGGGEKPAYAYAGSARAGEQES